MSWELQILCRSKTPTKGTYIVTASHASISLGPFEFQLGRKSILKEFERILPSIMISSIQFRSRLAYADLLPEKPIDIISGLGKQLYMNLGPEIKKRLSNASSIHIRTDDAELPWEFIYNDGGFLCLRSALGISPYTTRSPEEIPRIKGKLRILFIVDPKKNLPQATRETERIMSKVETNPKVEHVILEGENANLGEVQSILVRQHFDIIHFASHATFDEESPEESGVELADGLLQPRELYNMTAEKPPQMVFVNACESARLKESSPLEIRGGFGGLAYAFFDAGVSAYVGTTCPINDASASDMAFSFYENLLEGLTVGESLRKAKKGFSDRNIEDLSWCAFVLYGDPDSKLTFETERDIEAEIREYIKRQKGSFSIVECARELNIPISEVNRLIPKLRKDAG